MSWIFPLVLFIGIGQFMSRKLMDKMGGPNSLSFDMGKSNAKVYVKSSDGINFSDVEGVDEAEESLAEIVDYLHDPSKYREIGATMPKGVLLVGPPGTGVMIHRCHGRQRRARADAEPAAHRNGRL